MARKKLQPRSAAKRSNADSSSDDGDKEQRSVPEPGTESERKRAEPETDSDSDSDSGSEPKSKEQPPRENHNTPQKPSKSDEDSSSGEEEEEEEEKGGGEKEEEADQTRKEPPEKSEAKTDKGKSKVSASDETPTKKSTTAVHRIWSTDDEITLIKALLEYKKRYQKLPPVNCYGTFLSGMNGSFGFPVTEKQLQNKIRHTRDAYRDKKRKGSKANFARPHDKVLFELCEELYEELYDGIEAGSKKLKKEVSKVSSGDHRTENDDVADTDDVEGFASRYPFLTQMLKELSDGKNTSVLSSLNVVVGCFGEETRATHFEEKIKSFKVEGMKLTSEVIAFVADQIKKSSTI